MPNKKTQKETPSTPVLTNTELLRAATNDPSLSTTSYTLGNKTFTILDFSYDDYMKFVNYMSPLLDAFLKGLTSGAMGVDAVAGSAFSVQQLFQYCQEDIPEMALLVAKQSDPEITVEELKKLAGDPFKLAKLCLVQIKHNQIIESFADFFAQMTQILSQSLSSNK